MNYVLALFLPPLSILLAGRPLVAIVTFLIWIPAIILSGGLTHPMFILLAWILIYQAREDRRLRPPRLTLRTRFAPSPTGPLHLGHAFSALTAWNLAQTHGGTFLLRIEDIDTTRCRPAHEAAILTDLAWLGLAWPEPVLRQSDHLPRYAAALDRLAALGLTYPCRCTRADIRAALSAPQENAPHPLYPGTCRPRPMSDAAPTDAIRLNLAKALAATAPLTWTETGPTAPGTHPAALPTRRPRPRPPRHRHRLPPRRRRRRRRTRASPTSSAAPTSARPRRCTACCRRSSACPSRSGTTTRLIRDDDRPPPRQARRRPGAGHPPRRRRHPGRHPPTARVHLIGNLARIAQYPAAMSRPDVLFPLFADLTAPRRGRPEDRAPPREDGDRPPGRPRPHPAHLRHRPPPARLDPRGAASPRSSPSRSRSACTSPRPCAAAPTASTSATP